MTELTETAVEAAAVPTSITMDGVEYDFVLGFAEACTLEDRLGRPFPAILADFSAEPSLVVLREIFRVAVRRADVDQTGLRFGINLDFMAQNPADAMVAKLGVERGSQLVAMHAERIVQAILAGTGGVEVEGMAEAA